MTLHSLKKMPLAVNNFRKRAPSQMFDKALRGLRHVFLRHEKLSWQKRDPCSSDKMLNVSLLPFLYSLKTPEILWFFEVFEELKKCNTSLKSIFKKLGFFLNKNLKVKILNFFKDICILLNTVLSIIVHLWVLSTRFIGSLW